MAQTHEQETIRVLAAVIRRGDSILLCKRPTHKRHGGLWEFPGGKIEPPETHLDAARRELTEELGVTVSSVGSLLFTCQDPGSPYVIEFVATRVEGEPVPIEHDAMAWVTLLDAMSLALAPADERFLDELAQMLNRPGTVWPF